ncbi:MAG: hypothetical protein U1F77_09385 [Kiritimatiellia bacterium]
MQVHDLLAEEKTWCEHWCGKEMTLIGADEAVKIGYEPAFACTSWCTASSSTPASANTARSRHRRPHRRARPRRPWASPIAPRRGATTVLVIGTTCRSTGSPDRLSWLGWGASRATLCNIYLNAAGGGAAVRKAPCQESVLACPEIHHDDTPVRERQPGSGSM